MTNKIKSQNIKGVGNPVFSLNIKMPSILKKLAGPIIAAVCLCLSASWACSQDEEQQKFDAGKLSQALQKLEDKKVARPDAYALSCDWDLLQLKLRKAHFLLDCYNHSESVLEAVDRQLKKAAELQDSLEKKTASQPQPGIAEEAYFDDTDGSCQPFIRYLPPGYDRKNKYPLIVFLHGYSPYLNLVNWGLVPDALPGLAEKANALFVMPFARGNTDFQAIGEQDVLNVIDQMEKRYSIDEDRIILSGMSMGGMGGWTIGSHYPQMFAGLLIISGRGDFYFWHKLDRGALPSWQQYLVDKEFAASHLPNLSRLPILVFHGSEDSLIPVEEARRMKELLGNKNPEFKYHEFEGGDHWIDDKVFESKEIAEWIGCIRRKNPESFEYVAYHPAYSKAWWLRIGGFAENCRPAKVQVEAKDKEILIRASDAKEIIADRAKMPERIRRLPIVKDGDFVLKEADAHMAAKTAFHFGPVKDAFLEPFLFVDSGAGDAEMKHREIEWFRFAQSVPRITKEKDLTESDKASFNLFLFGEPETSPMIQEALKRTPIKIEKEEIKIADKSFPRERNGVIIRHRSPWNPAKSVVVQCGIPWGSECPENHIYDFLPGYIVYTAETDPLDPFRGNKALTAGFFDKNGNLLP